MTCGPTVEGQPAELAVHQRCPAKYVETTFFFERVAASGAFKLAAQAFAEPDVKDATKPKEATSLDSVRRTRYRILCALRKKTGLL